MLRTALTRNADISTLCCSCIWLGPPRRRVEMKDSAKQTAMAITAIGRIDAVPTLLAVLCETTGLRCAAVARVAGNNWTTCAIRDDIQLGIKVGDPLTG